MEATYDDSVINDAAFPGGNKHIGKFTISGMPEKGTSGEVPRIRVFLTQDHSGILRAQSALYMEEKVEVEEEDVIMKEDGKEGNDGTGEKEDDGASKKTEEDEGKKT